MSDTDSKNPLELTMDSAFYDALARLQLGQPAPEPEPPTHCVACGQKLKRKPRPDFHNLKVVK